MDPIATLEQRLKRTKTYNRGMILTGVYKQLAVSRKGKQADGEFRRYVEENPGEKKIFVEYLISEMRKYNLGGAADRLEKQVNEAKE